MSEEVMPMLPLDGLRQINLKAGKQVYSYYFRRLTDKDWATYYAGIINRTLQTDGHRERVYEAEAASIALVESTLTRVEGFGDVAAVDHWQAAIPLRHRTALGMVLRNVGASANLVKEAAPFGTEEVTLAAVWPLDGKSFLYDGLIHRFKHISPDQLKRFNYESARVRVEGDGENAVSSYPSRQLIAMRLYDDLIESVDGYAISGHALKGVEAIRAEMDGAHKAAAVLQLFEGGDDVAVE